MGYVTNKVKPPDSLAEVVALTALLVCEGRPKKDNHLLIGCMQSSRRRTYFTARSTHPMNRGSVHMCPALSEDKQMLPVRTHCTLVFYQRAEIIAQKTYALAEAGIASDDLLHFMDKGVVRPAPLVPGKGKELISK